MQVPQTSEPEDGGLDPAVPPSPVADEDERLAFATGSKDVCEDGSLCPIPSHLELAQEVSTYLIG